MKYTLTQEAYLTELHMHCGCANVDFSAVFAAAAQDEDGNEVTIYWLPDDNWEEMEDYECCDWDWPDFVDGDHLERDFWGVLTSWKKEDELA